jgi:hypothetical protein
MSYIHCPDCGAVRTMEAAECPECGRCANCGYKLAQGVQICECGFPADEKLARQIIRRYGIPDESVESEKAKWQKRKKMMPVLFAARLMLLGLCVFLGVITAVFLLAESPPITQAMVGVFVVCLLTCLYWFLFQGMVKILLWTARKLRPRGK